MQTLAGQGVVLGRPGHIPVDAQFADRSRAGILVQKGAEPFEKDEVFRALLVVDVVLEGVGVRSLDGIGHGVAGRGRIVAQQGVMEIEVDHVQPKAVDPHIQPETRRIEHGVLDLWIMEIEIRLGFQEVVQIVLSAARLPFPGAAAEQRQPVIGRIAGRRGVGPDIPVGLGVGSVFSAFFKPGVARARMADHQINQNFESQSVSFGQEGAKIVKSSEQGIDVAIVRNVIAKILHRRFEERRNPQGVHAERGYGAEFGANAGKIADPVAVGVKEGAGIDLIDHRAAPPIRADRQGRRKGLHAAKLRNA